MRLAVSSDHTEESVGNLARRKATQIRADNGRIESYSTHGSPSPVIWSNPIPAFHLRPFCVFCGQISVLLFDLIEARISAFHLRPLCVLCGQTSVLLIDHMTELVTPSAAPPPRSNHKPRCQTAGSWSQTGPARWASIS